MTNTKKDTFGVTTLVFFRRHATTNKPLLDDPQVWTFPSGTEGAFAAKDALSQLRSKTNLFVPEHALTVSTPKD